MARWADQSLLLTPGPAEWCWEKGACTLKTPRTVQRAQEKHLSVQEAPGRVGTPCPGDAICLEWKGVFHPFSNYFAVQKSSPALMVKVRQIRTFVVLFPLQLSQGCLYLYSSPHLCPLCPKSGCSVGESVPPQRGLTVSISSHLPMAGGQSSQVTPLEQEANAFGGSFPCSCRRAGKRGTPKSPTST